MSITNEDKFNLHFLKPKLKTNEKKIQIWLIYKVVIIHVIKN